MLDGQACDARHTCLAIATPLDVSERVIRSALLLKLLDGGADNVTLATLGKVLLEPTLTTLGNFLVRLSSVASASFTVLNRQSKLCGIALWFCWNRCEDWQRKWSNTPFICLVFCAWQFYTKPLCSTRWNHSV